MRHLTLRSSAGILVLYLLLSFTCCDSPSRNSSLRLFQKHHMLARPPKPDPDIPQTQATQGHDKMGSGGYTMLYCWGGETGRRTWGQELGEN